MGLESSSVGALLLAAAFLAVFVAGLFARSIVDHEFELWRRAHGRTPTTTTH